MDDRELVRRCVAGEPPGWETLAREKTPLLASAIRGALRRAGRESTPVVEDLLQETFLALARRDGELLRRFQWRCSLNHYLASIALYQTLAWLRRDPEWVSLDQKTRAGGLYQDLLADPKTPSSPDLDAAERLARFRRALEGLPARDRLLLKLSYWRDLPAPDIARILGTDANAIRVYLGRAREKLRKLLDQGRMFLL